MPIVFKQSYGPIRVAIDAQGPALALYKQAPRNKMVRNALRRGGVFWIGFYLGRRFSHYAQSVLQYPKITKQWAIRKAKRIGIIVPFMGLRKVGDPSKMVIASIAGARSSAVATSNKGEIRIAIPYGHPIPTEYSKSFRNIPAHEIQDIAKEVAAGLTAELAGNPLDDNNRRKAPKPRAVGGKPGRNTYRGQRRAPGAARQRQSVGI